MRRFGAIEAGVARRAAVLAAAGVSLAACATSQVSPAGVGAWGVNGTMKPYAVNGVRYTPRDQPRYDAVGLASWYAEQRHRETADGELFDPDVASGAHATLPLPCLVDVTNLDNGRRIRLRVNDRGPFAGGRILDVSRRAAVDLGFVGRGVARVRVRYVGPALLRGSAGPPEESAAPSPLRAAPPPPGARIQAGAFSSPAAAQRAARILSGLGAASVEPVEREGATLWRVVLTCAPAADAEALRAQVTAAGFPGARVLPAS